ncbi:hypothetical protein RHS01_10760 [Rhizoctonia solani]|uniref:Uncharacterized protein n=1 Tax=Rhizoctonia solani TaxID=456999 RepID=A0A8H7I2S9_9AGAM|nr:hypothetical protein RHS01_10760 [Rhizoctonia solani]
MDSEIFDIVGLLHCIGSRSKHSILPVHYPHLVTSEPASSPHQKHSFDPAFASTDPFALLAALRLYEYLTAFHVAAARHLLSKPPERSINPSPLTGLSCARSPAKVVLAGVREPVVRAVQRPTHVQVLPLIQRVHHPDHLVLALVAVRVFDERGPRSQQ